MEAETSAVADATVLYFGCIGGPGHYWVDPDGKRSLDPPLALGHIDGKYTPEVDRTQGSAQVAHVNGWTVLAIHDYTVDSRPGSNANIVVSSPALRFEEILAVAYATFPRVMERIGPLSAARVGEGPPAAPGGES